MQTEKINLENMIISTIESIIKDNSELLKLPIKKRAKFEGWLKFELAHQLAANKELREISVETNIINTKSRSDVSFKYVNVTYHIELKTTNANYRIQGIESRTRPIRGNIDSIIIDADKLSHSKGFVAFVMFPIPTNSDVWMYHLERIRKETGKTIGHAENSKILPLVYPDLKTNILICCFKTF